MNGLDLIRSAVFPVKTDFSRLPNFLSHIREFFIDLPFDYEIVNSRLEKVIADFENTNGEQGRDIILKKLLAEDLRKIRTSLVTNRKLIDEDLEIEESIKKTVTLATNLLNGIGIELKTPKIFFIEKYPPPYDRATGAAMAIDAWDERHYDIPRGLYFRISALCPIYSRFLATHEIVHSYLGEISPDFMGRGLEEGLAEIVGAIFLSKQILGNEVTKHTFYHNRLGFGINQYWQLYLDYARMSMYLYNRFGLSGLTSLMKQGRKKIKVVEGLCFQGLYSQIDLPSGHWDDDLTNIGSFIALTYSRDFVVSPLAYFVARYIEEGDTIEVLSQKCNLNKALVDDAVTELQDRVFVLVQNEARIDITDLKMLIEANAIRYEV